MRLARFPLLALLLIAGIAIPQEPPRRLTEWKPGAPDAPALTLRWMFSHEYRETATVRDNSVKGTRRLRRCTIEADLVPEGEDRLFTVAFKRVTWSEDTPMYLAIVDCTAGKDPVHQITIRSHRKDGSEALAKAWVTETERRLGLDHKVQTTPTGLTCVLFKATAAPETWGYGGILAEVYLNSQIPDNAKEGDTWEIAQGDEAGAYPAVLQGTKIAMKVESIDGEQAKVTGTASGHIPESPGEKPMESSFRIDREFTFMRAGYLGSSRQSWSSSMQEPGGKIRTTYEGTQSLTITARKK